MADREAKLRMLVELVGADKAAKVLERYPDILESAEKAADGAASAFHRAAADVDRLTAAEAEATGQSREAAGALQAVGASAAESSREAVSGATRSAAALEGVTAAAEGETAALRETASAGEQSGRDIAAGAAAGERALSEEVDVARRVRTELESVGDAAITSARTTAVAFTEAADGVRRTEIALEAQRIAIQAQAGELEKLTRKALEFGAEGREAADLYGTALTEVKGRLAEVTAAIEAQRTRIHAEADAILDLDKITAGATARIAEGVDQLNTKFAITPATLRNIGQAVEFARLEIELMADRGVAATAQQIAAVERLEGEYRQLIAVANRLQNSARDSAIGLRETSAQVQGIALSVQTLTAALGPNAAKLGMVVGNVGQLGATVDTLKDQLAAANPQLLGLATNAIKAGGPIAGLVAAFLAGAAAGTKMASGNKENAESLDRLVDAAKKVVPSMQDIRDVANSVADGFDGFQQVMQDLLSSIPQVDLAAGGLIESSDALTDRTRALVDVETEHEQRIDDVATTLNQLTIAFQSGRTGSDLYALGLRLGLKDAEAYKLGVADMTEVLRFYRDAQQTGAAGQQLLNQAMRESGGTAGGLVTSVRNLIPAMHELLGVQGKLPPELQKEFDARAKIIRQLEDSRRAYELERIAKQSASDATAANVRTAIEQNTVTDGSTAAINRRAEAIAAHILQSDLWSVSLGRQASELQTVLDETDGLTAAERARIQALIDLTTRANELTKAEQAHGKALAESIQNGNRAIAAANARKLSLDELVTALHGAREAELIGIAGVDERTASLANQLAVIREMIAAEEQKQGIHREDVAINLDRGVSLDFLRMKEAALRAVLEPQLVLTKASADAKKDESSARAELSAIIEKEAAAARDSASSHDTLFKVIDGGKVSITNLTEAERSNAAAGVEVDEAQKKIKKSGEEAADVIRRFGTEGIEGLESRMRSLIGVYNEFDEVAERANRRIREMNEAAKEAAAE